SYAAALHYFRPPQSGSPSGANLPTFLIEGPLTWPGQHAGFLGPRHDPWQITQNPNDPTFAMDNLRLAPGIEVGRLADRRALLGEVNRQQERLADLASSRRFSDQQHVAFGVLTSGRIASAF